MRDVSAEVRMAECEPRLLACRYSAMDRAQLIREVESFDPGIPIERAWTPPASWYTSSAIHDLELRGIMACSWQPVARVEQLS